MCVKCDRKQHCLRILAQYGSAQARVALESHMLRHSAQYGCESEATRQRSPLALSNLCVALLDFSRKNSVECDVAAWNSDHAAAPLPTPDPIQRHKSWQPVSFVEYVGSKVVAATHDRQSDSLHLTVRLFPLVSTGYVPCERERYNEQQCCTVAWPARHAPQWLRTQLPRVDFVLELLAEEKCVRAVAAAPQSAAQRYYCRATCGTAPLTTPRCYLEYCVCLPCEYLAL